MGRLKTIKAKVILFSCIISFAFFSITAFALWAIREISRSADIMYTDYIPLIEATHYASIASRDGNQAIDHLMLDVTSPEDFDKVREYMGVYKKTMMDFDMYMSAILLGSESAEFKEASGGLTYAMWTREGLEEKLIVKKAPAGILRLVERIESTYNVKAAKALKFMKIYRKALRLELMGKTDESAAVRDSLTGYRDAVDEAAESIDDDFRKINFELGEFLSETTAYIANVRRRTVTATLALSVVLLVFIVAASVVFPQRMIVSPIMRLTAGVRAFAGRKLHERIEVKSEDEIGQLAASFNKMGEDLQETTVSRDELAEEVVERQKAEEGLKRLTADLESANKELRESTAQLIQSEKLTAIGELTAGITHELNQPLNITKIICQSILRDIKRGGFDAKEAERDLPEVVVQMNKMAEIIDHMRIFTRKTEGAVQQTVDVNAIIEGAFKFLGQQMKDHGIDVSIEIAPDLPKVLGDPIRLEQVVMNLLTNARHALERSGKKEKALEVKVFAPEDRKSLIVQVKDNGVGIPEDIKEKIFEPFFTTKAAGVGTGLGLSLVKKIMDEHKGRIEVESGAGEGAVIRLIFPAAQG